MDGVRKSRHLPLRTLERVLVCEEDTNQHEEQEDKKKKKEATRRVRRTRSRPEALI